MFILFIHYLQGDFMKFFLALLILTSSAFAFSTEEDVIARCGDYKVIFIGSNPASFGGIEIQEEIFVIEDAQGDQYTGHVETHSEGGFFRAVNGAQVLTYHESWGQFTLSIKDKETFTSINCTRTR
jgi:hypothetical protein